MERHLLFTYFCPVVSELVCYVTPTQVVVEVMYWPSGKLKGFGNVSTPPPASTLQVEHRLSYTSGLLNSERLGIVEDIFKCLQIN